MNTSGDSESAFPLSHVDFHYSGLKAPTWQCIHSCQNRESRRASRLSLVTGRRVFAEVDSAGVDGPAPVDAEQDQ